MTVPQASDYAIAEKNPEIQKFELGHRIEKRVAEFAKSVSEFNKMNLPIKYMTELMISHWISKV